MIGLSALKALPGITKIVIIAALAGGIAGGGWYLHKRIYNAGYDARVQEERADYTLALQAAVASARADWELSAAAARDSSAIEENIVARIRDVEVRISKTIENTIRPECRDLGSDAHRLLVEATRAANNSAVSGPADPAEPAGPVP